MADWSRTSVRKPLAVYSTVWGAAICSLAFLLDRDIPPGAVTVMTAFIPVCVGSYAASSAYEATRKKDDEA
jgi:hypothetical protein